jgi:hypothetical protein
MLPSEVAIRATTFDVMVMDILAAYDQHEHERATGRVTPSNKRHTQSELAAILERARTKGQK